MLGTCRYVDLQRNGSIGIRQFSAHRQLVGFSSLVVPPYHHRFLVNRAILHKVLINYLLHRNHSNQPQSTTNEDRSAFGTRKFSLHPFRSRSPTSGFLVSVGSIWHAKRRVTNWLSWGTHLYKHLIALASFFFRHFGFQIEPHLEAQKWRIQNNIGAIICREVSAILRSKIHVVMFDNFYRCSFPLKICADHDIICYC